MATPRRGTVVDQKYRVVRVLGRGGMGVVVEAEHLQLGMHVALKFLRRHSEAATNRFLREARTVAALKSDHVCRIFDVGVFANAPYLVMERLDGIDLWRLLRGRGKLPAREACDYVIQACAGLAEAHARQIIHRDLKPGNLFLTRRPDGRPLIKVLDFGVAKLPPVGNAALTGSHAVVGSPPYMSLEQLRASKFVDQRCDIWSLGVILYELIAGRRPFRADSIADLALQIVEQPAPRLPAGPAGLDPIIARCLARDKEHRFGGVRELAEALVAFLEQPEVSARAEPSPTAPQASSSLPVHVPESTTGVSMGVVERPAARSRMRMPALVVAALLACATGVGVGFVVAWGGSGVEVPSPPAPPAVAPAMGPALVETLTEPAIESPTDPAPVPAVEAPAEPAAEPAPEIERPRPSAAMQPSLPRHRPPSKPKRPTRSKPAAPMAPGVIDLSKSRI